MSNYSITINELNHLTKKSIVALSPQKQILSDKKDTIEILKKTKDDIISSELIIKDKCNTKVQSLDYISETQKLSGPLGDFYEGTSVEMEKEHLLVYLQHNFDTFEIKELNIMTSDGEEYNILE